MRKFLRGLLLILAILLLLSMIIPLLIPVPPLSDTQPVQVLAGENSQFIEVQGVQIHTEKAGQGEPRIILLHGFAASLYSWRQVMQPLAEMGTVLAYDRVGFGLTERPTRQNWQEMNPYSAEAQIQILLELMDIQGIQSAILIGNSAGGSLALQMAIEHPERVQALVLVDASVYQTRSGSAIQLLRPLGGTPQVQRIGRLLMRRIQSWGLDFARRAWHNPDLITPEDWEGYQLPLQAENWDLGLWEYTLASQSLDLEARLDQVALPVLVVSGDDDQIVPMENSIKLAGAIDGATLAVFPSCGHVPQEECPDDFLSAVRPFIETLSVP